MGKKGLTEFAAPFGQGFILQASLIAALGAQNIYVLESGLRRRKHWQVAALCSACDALLITLGVFGAGQLFLSVPVLQAAMGAAGVAFLVWYAVQKLREGLSPTHATEPGQSGSDLARPLVTALAFSLLNPHVYLDTVVLIGGFSTTFGDAGARAAFGLGAAVFSVVWFFGLAGLASRMSAVLASDAGRRGVALGSAAILFILSAVLGAQVWVWIRALL